MSKSMKKLLLIGAGGLGRVVLEHASKEYECAFVDDSKTGTVDGAPIIGKISDIQRLRAEYDLLLVTMGDNSLRAEVYKAAEAEGYAFPNLIVSSAYVSSHAHIGSGNIVLNNAVIQNNATLGNGCILNPGVELHHDSMVGDFVLIYTNSVVRSLAHVGNGAWIGSTTTIATRATVPDDGVVSNSSVVETLE